MWGGVQAGTQTCGCGQVLQWSDRDGVDPLQWHFLQCTLAAETSVRRRWRAAIKRTIVAVAPDLYIVEKVLACWTHLTDGTIHTAAGDQVSDWRPPKLAECDLGGSWDFVPSGVSPSFGLCDVQSGSGSDDDAAASDVGGAMQIVTANGTAHLAIPRMGTESSGHVARLSRRRISYTTLDNALTPPADGQCAGRPARSHLPAVRLTSTPAKLTSQCASCVSTLLPISRNGGS